MPTHTGEGRPPCLPSQTRSPPRNTLADTPRADDPPHLGCAGTSQPAQWTHKRNQHVLLSLMLWNEGYRLGI